MPIFAASNISFDYAAECGKQALIDTTPFKSHPTRAAFYFCKETRAVISWAVSRNLVKGEP